MPTEFHPGHTPTVPTEAERLFETIANYTYDWETWFDSEGKARWINPAVERMTGLSVATCLAMPDYPIGLVHPEDRARIAALLDEARAGSSGNDIEFRLAKCDGSLGWAAVSWQPIHDATGNRLGFRSSMRDITRRKRVEAALAVAKQEAERANRAKSQFLAAASHDLRQPLQAMSMYIAALKQHGLNPSARRLADDLVHCVDACRDLLAGLLDVSRLDAGAVSANPGPVMLADIFEEIETELRGKAQERKLDLRIIASSEVVEADQTILVGILRNLVDNALSYTPAGKILLGCRRLGANRQIIVADTGIGIPADKLDMVFEEFFQLDNPERDRRKGLGLGLAIVRRLAALGGYAIDVKSAPGAGSRFTITVPAAGSTLPIAAPTADRARQTSPIAGVTLAIVEDEPAQLKAFEMYFSGLGCVVAGGTDAAGVIAALDDRGLVPDVIVADYRLRDGRTGTDAIREIRRAVGRDTPGMLLTGDTDIERLAAAAASEFGLLHKPVAPDHLIVSLLDALGTRQATLPPRSGQR
ncbi:MAG: ATP-binding protein [Hyphomicrobiaceae bacterium]